MAGDIALRPGTAADAATLAGLHRAARAAAMPGIRERWSEAEVAAWLRAVPMAAPGGVLVATDPVGGILGYLARDRAAAEVLHLYVAPDAWRRGVGSRLLRAAQQEAGAGGLALFCLRRNHQARAFYERHGFRPVAERDDPGANEEGEPDLRYAWRPLPDRTTSDRMTGATT